MTETKVQVYTVTGVKGGVMEQHVFEDTDMAIRKLVSDVNCVITPALDEYEIAEAVGHATTRHGFNITDDLDTRKDEDLPVQSPDYYLKRLVVDTSKPEYEYVVITLKCPWITLNASTRMSHMTFRGHKAKKRAITAFASEICEHQGHRADVDEVIEDTDHSFSGIYVIHDEHNECEYQISIERYPIL